MYKDGLGDTSDYIGSLRNTGVQNGMKTKHQRRILSVDINSINKKKNSYH